MKLKQTILKSTSIKSLLQAQEEFLADALPYKVIFKRYFLADEAGAKELPQEEGAVSHIIQKPLDGSAAGVWIVLAADADVSYGNRRTIVCENGRTHCFDTDILAAGPDSHAQTQGILEAYENSLLQDGMTIEANCLRTWFFVHDIDNNYAGLVKARRDNFTQQGLTKDTHYIASTGIAGSPVDPSKLVHMDAYAVKGPFEQRYLYAPTHLNPTYEYGVTFERGTRADFGELSCTLISGTASINNKGEVVHVGDVQAQAARMLENVEVLLAEAGHSWDGVGAILVYIRNAEDYAKVEAIFSQRFPGKPYIILKAPVCRPTWLIEIECISVQ